MMNRLLLILAFMPCIVLGQNPVNDKLITVTGNAEMEIEPDIIVLGMTVRESENSKKESATLLMERNIISFLKSIGVAADAFKVDRYNANSEFTYSSATKFSLSKSYQITLNKVKLLDTVLVKCIEYGMDRIYINRLDYSKADSLQKILLSKAIRSAKEKAKLIVDNLDISLGKVYSVNEGYRIIENQSDFYKTSYNNQMLEAIAGGAVMNFPARMGNNLSLQKISFSKTVIVRFEVE